MRYDLLDHISTCSVCKSAAYCEVFAQICTLLVAQGDPLLVGEPTPALPGTAILTSEEDTC
jgi:hypothetical protein